MRIRKTAFTRHYVTAALTMVLAGLIATTCLSTSIASSARTFLRLDSVSAAQKAVPKAVKVSGIKDLRRAREVSPLAANTGLSALLTPQFQGETVATYAANCTTPKISFNLGETVCAKVVGAPVGGVIVQRFFQWANTEPLVVRQSDISSDPQTDSFTLPTANTSVVSGVTVDNRGTWRVNAMDTSDGSVRATAFFTVHDPAAATADLRITNAARFDSTTPAAGSDVVFVAYVKNDGPDNAANTALRTAVPSNTTFVSMIQNSGPAFSCASGGGTSTCTIASFAPGAEASFSFTVHVNSGTADGTQITDTADISSTTTEKDSTNNSSSDTVSVTTPTCTITPPPDITKNNDLDAQGHALGGAVVTYSAPTTSSTANPSSCGTVQCTLESNSFFPIGVNTVTCTDTVNDPVHFKVTVVDTAAPTISCPANVTAPESSHGSGSANVTYPDPTATDNSGQVTVTTDHASGSSFTVGTTTVTATATDGAGHTATCTFNVTVVASDCTLTCPSNITQAPDAGQNGAIVTYSPVTTTGTCGAVTYSQASGTFFPLGTTTVTATAAGGETCSFKITITTDTTPPTITCPSDVVQPAPAGSCQATVNPGTPTATDDNPGVTTAGVRSDGLALSAPFAVGETIITWTATDAAGNTASCDQSVKVTENVPPSVTAPAPVTVNVNATCDNVEVPNFVAVVSDPNNHLVSDNCTPLANLEISQNPGAETLVGVGSYPVTITVTDVSGNTATATATFNVVDNTPPTITLNGASAVTVECHTSFTDPGASTTDNCTAAPAITTSGNLDVNTPGTYTLTYTATDASGNHASVQRTVTVVDTTPPVITLIGANPMTVECHTSFTDPGATASDSCDSSVATTVSGSVNVNTPGTYVLTYNAHDASGNNATAVARTVSVVDTTPPAISCPANIVAYLPLHSTATSMAVNFSVTATDSCSSTVSVTSSPASGSVFPVGTTTVNSTATDPAGNSSSCSFTVTVLYDFTGFFSPVNNLPTLNVVNAGRAIPVKFSLSGNKGLNIFAVNSPQVGIISCDASAPATDLTDTVTAGSSSLSYDAGSDQYIYVWKTDSSWAGTCRQLVVTLNDGSVYVANFKFK